MTGSFDLSANPNTAWAKIFLNELALAGLRHVCFAPGSRSTPLVLAASDSPRLQLHRHLDERSAAFFALGMAQASQEPVALICTSGTAVANFHPAVIEAFQSRIPLIVLSADRPPELRGSGANQTIDQLKMFGDHVRLFMEMPVPQADAPEVTVRHIRTSAARAYAAASGPVAGPVHVNFPFRKPLEPSAIAPVTSSTITPTDLGNGTAFTRFSHGELAPTRAQVERLAEVFQSETDGLIVCGPDYRGQQYAADLAALADITGYPIVADPLSGLRHGSHLEDAVILGGYDLLLQAVPSAWPAAKVILRFGDVPTSASLAGYIAHAEADIYIHVRGDGVWADDQHLVRELWHVNEARLCQEAAAALRERGFFRASNSWRDHFQHLEERVWQEVDQLANQPALTDAKVVSTTLNALTGSTVFAGNSLPIRHVDAFDRPSARPITVFGNRGASGIDGNVSTAIGIAAASGRPVVALLGDITFYHDLNGLLALRGSEYPPLLFVVINNDGGGIFRRLPVAAQEPPFTELFRTPHGITFEHAAALYGLDYHCIASDSAQPPTLDHLFSVLANPGRPTIFEVITDAEADFAEHRRLLESLRVTLRSDETLAVKPA